MKQEGYGRGYEYAHGQTDAQVSHSHLPDKLVGKRFYNPENRGKEVEIRKNLEEMTKKQKKVSRETK
jgi:putative ATPase